jgi:hypothetical protein
MVRGSRSHETRWRDARACRETGSAAQACQQGIAPRCETRTVRNAARSPCAARRLEVAERRVRPRGQPAEWPFRGGCQHQSRGVGARLWRFAARRPGSRIRAALTLASARRSRGAASRGRSVTRSNPGLGGVGLDSLKSPLHPSRPYESDRSPTGRTTLCRHRWSWSLRRRRSRDDLVHHRVRNRYLDLDLGRSRSH